MDAEETIKFLNNTLAADIDPHVDAGNPLAVMEAFLERTGLDKEALRHEAMEALGIGMLTGRLIGQPPSESLEAIWLSAFHYGYIAAEAMAFRKRMGG